MHVPPHMTRAIAEQARARRREADLELARLQEKQQRRDMINSLPNREAAIVVGLSFIAALFKKR